MGRVLVDDQQLVFVFAQKIRRKELTQIRQVGKLDALFIVRFRRRGGRLIIRLHRVARIRNRRKQLERLLKLAGGVRKPTGEAVRAKRHAVGRYTFHRLKFFGYRRCLRQKRRLRWASGEPNHGGWLAATRAVQQSSCRSWDAALVAESPVPADIGALALARAGCDPRATARSRRQSDLTNRALHRRKHRIGIGNPHFELLRDGR